MAVTFLFAAFVFLIALGLMIIGVMSVWKLYTKAGKPGWAGLIPIYNIYILLQIIHRPTWWIIFYCIPVVNAVFLKANLFGNQIAFPLVIASLLFSLIIMILQIIISISLAKSFGRSTVFGIFLLWLLPFIGYLILGLGKSTYIGGVVPQSQSSQT